jgi:hypothetical protein
MMDVSQEIGRNRAAAEMAGVNGYIRAHILSLI